MSMKVFHNNGLIPIRSISTDISATETTTASSDDDYYVDFAPTNTPQQSDDVEVDADGRANDGANGADGTNHVNMSGSDDDTEDFDSDEESDDDSLTTATTSNMTEEVETLFCSIYGKDVETLTTLLENNSATIDLNKILSPSYFTPLKCSVDAGSLEVAQVLLEHGADPNDSNIYESSLSLAARNNMIEMAQLLLNYGADVNHKDVEGDFALYDAVSGNKFEMVEFLLDHGADINLANNQGVAALNVAVRNNIVEMVDYLFEHGAEIETDHSHSPICEALVNENFDMILHLLECGATITTSNGERTYLTYGVHSDGYEIVKYFIQDHDVDVNMMGYNGNTLLYEAVFADNLGLVRYLVDMCGADVDLVNVNGISPLALAISDRRFPLHKHININNRDAIIKFLIKHDANVNVAIRGRSILSIAVKRNEIKYVKLLLKHGANPDGCVNEEREVNEGSEVNEGANLSPPTPISSSTTSISSISPPHARTNNKERPPLLLAVRNNAIHMVKLLVGYGATVNIEADTPLLQAVKNNNDEMVDFLLEHGATYE